MKIQLLAALAALTLCGTHAQETAPSVIAIDVLLDADAAMLKHAEAFKCYYAPAGPISAFTAPHDNPKLDGMLIAYVSTFVPKMSGENCNPHLSTGTAPTEYLDKMNAERFETFTFSPAGAAIYQLGPFGAAAKKLKAWDLKF